jgi:hypothetical protein
VPAPLFAADAGIGSYTIVHFAAGAMVISRFGPGSELLGQTTIPAVDPSHASFCLQVAGGTFYSQDARNGGAAQVLTYESTSGCGYPCMGGLWYLGFEGASYTPASTFTSVLIALSTELILPARPATWGVVKNLYR